MAASIGEQIIGVDVGGTFTDLVAFDGETLRVAKIPSTPPMFDRAVVEAVKRAREGRDGGANIVHGSTVATNALLQRAGAPVAFITTEGFHDMLLIGRQNRPRLYALNIQRPAPLTAEENWFAVRERIGADGEIVVPLDEAQLERLIATIVARGLGHVAVCLLFSFINPKHEQQIGERCLAAGLTVSLSSEVLPEFREYERASTTVINAALRPTVEAYLSDLKRGLAGPDQPLHLRIMHSCGGTLSVEEAARSAAKLVLSGPAGGVVGAALVAALAGESNVITYDMGGTSTDVAAIIDAKPQWSTASVVDGLPLGLSTLDIETVGAGGGSIAFLDAGGALRVGPRSAGAVPGPACYGRGGTLPSVTDANLVLGRLIATKFLGGKMPLDPNLARQAIQSLADAMGKNLIDTALGIIRVAEANMSRAIRAVSAQRGHDPRAFALLSFGGAGGLHACALAESLDIPRVIVPPYCGVLSALGMIAAAPLADASQTVVHLEKLDDARIAAEYTRLSGITMEQIPYEQTHAVEAWADVRFKGQSHELKVRVNHPSLDSIGKEFCVAYVRLYGSTPAGKPIEIVTLRIRRIGRGAGLKLPALQRSPARDDRAEIVTSAGERLKARLLSRGEIPGMPDANGPALVVDDEATTYVPPGWKFSATENGTVVLTII